MADSFVDVGKVSGEYGVSTETGVLWKVHVAQVLVQVAYGSSFVLSKVALTTGVDLIVFSVYRDIVCLAALLPLAYITERKRTPLTLPVLGLIFVSAFFGGFLTQLLVLIGLSLTSAAYASTLSIVTPLFTFIISTAFGIEQIHWRRWDGQLKLLGLLLSVGGALVLALYFGPVILGPEDFGFHNSGPDSNVGGIIGILGGGHDEQLDQSGSWKLGVSLLFLAGISLSMCISLQAPVLAKYPFPFSVSVIGYSIGTLFMGLTALITVEGSSAWVITDAATIVSIIYNGVITSAFNFAVLLWSVQKAGPVIVGAYHPLQLFAAAAMGYLFLKESIHLGSVLGALLIILGLGFITSVKFEEEKSLIPKLKPDFSAKSVSEKAVSQGGLAEPLLGWTPISPV